MNEGAVPRLPTPRGVQVLGGWLPPRSILGYGPGGASVVRGMTTVAKILKGVGNPHLSLYKGEGYWYFAFDDGGERYETQSVMVMRLRELSLEEWVAEGRSLCNRMGS